MNEEDEHMIRRALEELAAESPPSSWSDHAEAVGERIRDRRRRARGTVATGLVASATAAIALVAVTLSGTGEQVAGRAIGPGAAPVSSRVAGAATAPATGTASAGPSRAVAPMVPSGRATAVHPSGAVPASVEPGWPPVRVAQPGGTVEFAQGFWMTLTSTERCIGYGASKTGMLGCRSSLEQKPGTVSLQSYGYAPGIVYSPLYVGKGQVARMTVHVAGQTFAVTVVTLLGQPGYATGYAFGPVFQGKPTKDDLHATVVVYDARGKVLAELG